MAGAGSSAGSAAWQPNYVAGSSANGVRAGSPPTSTASNKKKSTNPYMVAYRNAAKQINANYDDQLRQMEADRAAYLSGQEAARNAWRNQALATYNSNRAQAEKEQNASLDKTNTGYDASAKQNYINYMQAQKGLASQLNALGIRGGASESSAIRMNTNYGSNVAANEAARNTALANLREAYEKSLFELQSQYNQSLNDYDDEYRQRLATYNDNYNTNRSSTLANKNSALTNAYITAQENKIKYNQEQRALRREQFKETIVGRYTKKESYKKLIEKLKKSNDPDKKYKINLARQAMNQLDEGGSSGGGGGGGRSYGGGYSSYSGGGSTSTATSTPSSVSLNAARSASTSGGGGTYTYSSKKSSTTKKSSRTTSRSSGRTTTGRNRRSISRGNGLIY